MPVEEAVSVGAFGRPIRGGFKFKELVNMLGDPDYLLRPAVSGVFALAG